MAKTIIGIVASNKTDKTITVVSHGRKTHPIYKKQYPVSKKFMAHDPNNEAQPGDKVSIIETRPLSARKRFILDKILDKPALRADSLTVTKDEAASERPKSKAKAKDEAEEESK
jgi:small subunit ribosomal protein S17